MDLPVGRYLVTGCAGFVGSHLVDALLKRGDAVLGIDSFSDYYSREAKEANLSAARESLAFELLEADLAETQLAPALAGVDGVFHFAARPGVRASWGDSFPAYVRDNLVVTQRLLEAAAHAAVRVVFASSSSVYGDAETHPTPEEVPFQPRSPYGVTKVACEHLAAAYARTLGLDVVVLRFFTVFGPRQRPDMAIGRILTGLVTGSPFDLLGNGAQSRDFTYVRDAVDAAILAMEGAPSGAVYNVGGGCEASLLEVIELAEKLAGASLDVAVQGKAEGDVRRTSADTKRIRATLAWAPTTGLERGLRQQLEWTRRITDDSLRQAVA